MSLVSLLRRTLGCSRPQQHKSWAPSFNNARAGGNRGGSSRSTTSSLNTSPLPSTTTSNWSRMNILATWRPPPLPQFFQAQVRCMSKFLSKSAKKRLNLTTKRAHKGFYKGKGSTQEGRLNSKGRFIVNPLKRLELVVPDLTGFRLKPYIAAAASKFPPEERHTPGRV